MFHTNALAVSYTNFPFITFYRIISLIILNFNKFNSRKRLKVLLAFIQCSPQGSQSTIDSSHPVVNYDGDTAGRGLSMWQSFRSEHH